MVSRQRCFDATGTTTSAGAGLSGRVGQPPLESVGGCLSWPFGQWSRLSLLVGQRLPCRLGQEPLVMVRSARMAIGVVRDGSVITTCGTGRVTLGPPAMVGTAGLQSVGAPLWPSKCHNGLSPLRRGWRHPGCFCLVSASLNARRQRRVWSGRGPCESSPSPARRSCLAVPAALGEKQWWASPRSLRTALLSPSGSQRGVSIGAARIFSVRGCPWPYWSKKRGGGRAVYSVMTILGRAQRVLAR